MSKQVYLLDKYKEETKEWNQYSVMSPFITKAKGLIKPGVGTRDWKFTPSGMGRTRIGEELFRGESPLTFYNRNMSTSSQALRRELLIREFFHQAKKDWEPRRSKASWLEPGSKSDKLFAAWKYGETGYPLIDAGMSQLAYEGWMPNRVRMLCASFLTKNLQIWWLKGEQYFAKNLVDYNIDSNVGNWQWISGVGFNTRLTDVMSPELQQKKFDKDFKYCRPWLGKKLSTDGTYSVPVLIDYQESKENYLKTV
jgi:deoxyribodipyrimidine photo-lyase